MQSILLIDDVVVWIHMLYKCQINILITFTLILIIEIEKNVQSILNTMAVNVYQKVEKRSTRIVVSTSSMKYKASDGSLHMVPVINSNAIAMLRNYGSEENEKVFEMSNEVEILPPAMKNIDIHKIIMPDNTEFINYLAENSIIKKEMRCENCRSECQSKWKTTSFDSFV